MQIVDSNLLLRFFIKIITHNYKIHSNKKPYKLFKTNSKRMQLIITTKTYELHNNYRSNERQKKKLMEKMQQNGEEKNDFSCNLNCNYCFKVHMKTTTGYETSCVYYWTVFFFFIIIICIICAPFFFNVHASTLNTVFKVKRKKMPHVVRQWVWVWRAKVQ